MSEKIITSAPTEDEVLTASLKLVVDRFVDMGYEEKIIFGKVNLILNDFITPEGTFTEEYIKLAKQALETRASKEFQDSLILEDKPEEVSLIIPGGGIGGR
jgi:hypothetical protein